MLNTFFRFENYLKYMIWQFYVLNKFFLNNRLKLNSEMTLFDRSMESKVFRNWKHYQKISKVIHRLNEFIRVRGHLKHAFRCWYIFTWGQPVPLKEKAHLYLRKTMDILSEVKIRSKSFLLRQSQEFAIGVHDILKSTPGINRMLISSKEAKDALAKKQEILRMQRLDIIRKNRSKKLENISKISLPVIEVRQDIIQEE